MKLLKKYVQKENGISLVEVIASIVLISIILLSFYKLFLQSATTTKTTEHIIDATYVAQTEMEKFYSLSKSKNFPNELDQEVFTGYQYKRVNNGFYIYENKTDYSNYLLELKLKPLTNNLTRIVVKVYDKKGVLKSQMETTLDWGDS